MSIGDAFALNLLASVVCIVVTGLVTETGYRVDNMRGVGACILVCDIVFWLIVAAVHLGTTSGC